MGDMDMVPQGVGMHSDNSSFLYFYERFFDRYTFFEFACDVCELYRIPGDKAALLKTRILAENTPIQTQCQILLEAVDGAGSDILHKALNHFLAGNMRQAQCEAVFSIRVNGITTRTIRNWKDGEAVYSERSSRKLNSLFNRHLPANAQVNRQRLAWLWLAFKLKLNDEETNRFLGQHMNEQHIYVLDLYEVILRAAISINSQTEMPLWDFFDALDLCLSLQEEICGGNALLNSSRSRVLEVLRKSPDGNSQDLLNELSQIYEDILNSTHDVGNALSEPAITRMLEDEFLEHFASAQGEKQAAPQRGLENRSEIAPSPLRSFYDLKAWVGTWIHKHKPYFQMAYVSWLLAILRLLLAFAEEASLSSGERNLFVLFYYNFTKAVTLADKSRHASFPANIPEMASTLEYAEGITLEKFAHKQCLIYFGRLFDAPLRLSRQRLIEFYFMTRLHKSDKAELNLILVRHHFSGLGDDNFLVDRFFDSDKSSSIQTMDDFVDYLIEVRDATDQTAGSNGSNGSNGSRRRPTVSDWPITEKLFYWKHPRLPAG